jgi:hypothetical protein
MVTVKSILFPDYYSSCGHWIPKPEDVYGDVIGRSYPSVRAMIAACKACARGKTYHGTNGVWMECGCGSQSRDGTIDGCVGRWSATWYKCYTCDSSMGWPFVPGRDIRLAQKMKK